MFDSIKGIIRFKRRSRQMPKVCTNTMVIGVYKTHFNNLADDIRDGKVDLDMEVNQIPKSDLLVITLLTHATQWQTLRRWTLDKEAWYRRLLGHKVGIEIEVSDFNKRVVRK